jgi:heptosyltransferase-2
MISIERIIVRSPNWVGDAVLSTPAVRAIRENFPAAQITLVAKPWVAPVFLHNPCVDNIYRYESEGRHGGWLGKVRLVKKLRREKFDLAILFQNAFEAALLVFLAGVRVRLGYATDCRRVFLTHAIDVDQHDRDGHQIGYYLGILEGASLESKGEQLTIVVSDRERVRAEETLRSCKVRPESPLVGINPGAAYGSSKRWPLARYAALCEKIRRLRGAEIIIFGGSEEQAVGQKISSLMKGRCTDLCGRTNLREAIALIEKCRLFITNDSGLMHVAAALDIPLVAIFGSTDPKATGPRNPRSWVVQSPVSCAPCFKRECPEDHRCMKRISVDQVYAVVDTLL